MYCTGIDEAIHDREWWFQSMVVFKMEERHDVNSHVWINTCTLKSKQVDRQYAID
jgi:hypothetical protein